MIFTVNALHARDAYMHQVTKRFSVKITLVKKLRIYILHMQLGDTVHSGMFPHSSP